MFYPLKFLFSILPFILSISTDNSLIYEKSQLESYFATEILLSGSRGSRGRYPSEFSRYQGREPEKLRNMSRSLHNSVFYLHSRPNSSDIKP